MHFLCLWRQSHPIVFYTGARNIRAELRGWNEKIKLFDRTKDKRACGLGGRLLKKKIQQPNRASSFLTVHTPARGADAGRSRAAGWRNQEIPKMRVTAG